MFQYFGWVGSCLLAALLAANWCISTPVAPARPSDIPPNEKINIRIHTDHKWPERVEFDTTSSVMAAVPNFDPTKTEVWPGQSLAAAEERAPFEAFAKMPACLRQPRKANASSIEGRRPGNRARSATAPHTHLCGDR